MSGDEYVFAKAVFDRMKNDRGEVQAAALVDYFVHLGMPEEWVTATMRKIDVDSNNFLTWQEYGTKISIINKIRKHPPLEIKRPRSRQTIDILSPKGILRKSQQITPRFEISSSSSESDEESVVVDQQQQWYRKKNGRMLEISEYEFVVDGDITNDDITQQLAVVQQLDREALDGSKGEEEEEESETELSIDGNDCEEDERPTLRSSNPVFRRFSQDKPTKQKKHNFVTESPDGDRCITPPADYVESILHNENALQKKGFAVIEVSPEVSHLSKRHIDGYKKFVQAQIHCCQIFTHKQANSYHNHPTNLQKPFAMRMCGKSSHITTPSNPSQNVHLSIHDSHHRQQDSEDIGVIGMTLYEQMDQICRKMVSQTLKNLRISSTKIDLLLDPINQIGKPVVRDHFTPEICYSAYVHEGYISSSILETNHNTAYRGTGKMDINDIFSGSHTDGGLVTAQILSDIPGLELYDQELEQWIAIEQLVHNYCHRVGKYPNQYAVVYWGRAVSYIKGGLGVCVHRVRKGNTARYSVEFKQRPTPLTTPCRNKEDQALMDAQLNALQQIREQDKEKEREEKEKVKAQEKEKELEKAKEEKEKVSKKEKEIPQEKEKLVEKESATERTKVDDKRQGEQRAKNFIQQHPLLVGTMAVCASILSTVVVTRRFMRR